MPDRTVVFLIFLVLVCLRHAIQFPGAVPECADLRRQVAFLSYTADFVSASVGNAKTLCYELALTSKFERFFDE